MLIMFMLEAAFRAGDSHLKEDCSSKDSCPEHGGVTIVLDVRHLSSVVWQVFEVFFMRKVERPSFRAGATCNGASPCALRRCP